MLMCVHMRLQNYLGDPKTSLESLEKSEYGWVRLPTPEGISLRFISLVIISR